jgi:hypothetical protein
MIDTVGFEIPVSQKVYRQMMDESSVKAGFEPIGDDDKRKINYKFFNTKITVGSYSRDINIQLIDNENKHDWENNRIYIEFSVPKMAFGHNVDLISLTEFYTEVRKISEALRAKYGKGFPSYKNSWLIRRLDLCWIWKLASQDQAEQFMEVLKLLKYHAKTKQYKYPTSVSFVCQDYTNKFYLKFPEYIKHDFKALKEQGKLDLAYQVLNKAKGVLRYEVTLRSGKIAQLFGELNLETLPNYDLKSIMRIFLDKLLKMDTTTSGSWDASLALIKMYGAAKGRILYQFWSAYYSDNEIDRKVILDNYSRSQIYRNLADIKKAGVGVKYKENISIDLSIPEK